MSRVFKTKDGSFVFVSNNVEVSTLSQSGGFSMKEIAILSGGTPADSKIVYSGGIDINNGRLRVLDDGKNILGTAITAVAHRTAGVGETFGSGKLHFIITDYTDAAAGVGGGLGFGGVFTTGSIPNSDLCSIKMEKENATSGNYSFGLGFWTRENGANQTKKMFIAANGALTVPYNITLGNASQNQKQTIYSSSVSILAFEHSSSLYNWCIRTNETVASAFQIFPSTAAGGTTYSTPALTITPAGAVTVTGGTLSVLKVKSSGSDNYSQFVLEPTGTGGCYFDFSNTLRIRPQAGAVDGITITSTGAVTVGASSLVGSGFHVCNGAMAFRGAGQAGMGADTTVIGNVSGVAQFTARGTNTTTRGNYYFYQTESDDGNSILSLQSDVNGAWTIGAAGALTTSVHLIQSYDGTATIATFQCNYYSDDGVIDVGGTGTKLRIGRSGGRAIFTGINETAADTDNKAVYIGDTNVLNTNTSIAKSKGNITPSVSLLNELTKIQVSTFQRKLNTTDENGNIVYSEELSQFVELGVIADNIKENCPELSKTCLFYDKKGELLGVHVDRLTSACIKVIQELNAKIEALEARLN